MDQISHRPEASEADEASLDRSDETGPDRARSAPEARRTADGRSPGDQHDVLVLGGPESERDPSQEGGDGKKPGLPSKWVFIGVAVVALSLLAWGAYGHWKQSSAASETQDQAAHMVASVQVVKATTLEGPMDLTLPGETQPFSSANIYARATGYVTDRRVDIGTRVQKGDLLAHISSPDLDQQLTQALAQLGQVNAQLLQSQANVSQAEANLNLARVNLSRAQALVGQGYETLQNRDQLQANQVAQSANLDSARAGVKVAQANVQAQQAGIDRLRALTAFEDVKAPFDGIVTVRNVDLGDLVNADSATGSPMFTVDQDDILRIMVQVPQNAAPGIRDGLEARVMVPQMPGRTFIGTVSRSSVALQSSARTLTVEVDLPNRAGTLRAGLYTYVSLAIPRPHPEVVLPAETLIFDQHGTHVAVVGEGDKVKMVPIRIDRDLGTSFEIDQGPEKGASVVLNPPTSLEDGLEVKVEDNGAKGTPPSSGAQTAEADAGAKATSH